jgi:penicillin-binding protein 1C
VKRYIYIYRYICICISLFLLAGTAHALPVYDEVRAAYCTSDSVLLDRHGDPLYELRTDKQGRRLDWTPLSGISPALVDAVLYAEDKRFYDHGGVDLWSMGAALITGLASDSLRGASTITMQLASILNPELQPHGGKRTIRQKARQILEARAMEKSWSKQEIMEAYLNLVTFRGELEGIAAASRGLFGKAPHGLDHGESLVLASLIRSPNATAADIAARTLLLREALGWTLGEDEIHASINGIVFGPYAVRPRLVLAPHVSRILLRGTTRGRTVSCTVDSRIQRLAIDRLQHHLTTLQSQNVTDGACLVVENRTGEVLAYVSYSGEPAQTRFVDGVRAKRQAGSTMKPFLYALAFDSTILTPASVLEDAPLDIPVFAGIYQPSNYDEAFKGLVTARVALASSLNVPAVKTLALVGIEPFLALLRRLGIEGLNESGDFYGPSLALGSADVSLWELTNAYRCLANNGTWSELRLIPQAEGSPRATQVFSPEAVFLVSDILSDREARSITFGLENPLATRFWTAVKTGTSKDMRDNWCIGYSPRYTVGVWVGNFSGEPMWNVSGISGAAPIWIEIMNQLHYRDIRRDDTPDRTPPQRLVRREIRSPQGISRDEWFIQGTQPDAEDQHIGQFNCRITYPPSGTVIALDPDIPPELQKVFFVAHPASSHLRWVLNEGAIMEGADALPWTPQKGSHTLTLVDEGGRTIDSVQFEVRGPSEK